MVEQRYEVRADWLAVHGFLKRVTAGMDFYACVAVVDGQWTLWGTDPYGFVDRGKEAPPLPDGSEDARRYLARLRWTPCFDTPDTLALDLQVTGHEPFATARGLCCHLQATVAHLDVLSNCPGKSVLRLRAVATPTWFQGGAVWDIFTDWLPGFLQREWRMMQTLWVREAAQAQERETGQGRGAEPQECGPSSRSALSVEGQRELVAEYWRDKAKGLTGDAYWDDGERGRMTQAEWAKQHNVSERTLRRYIKKHADLGPKSELS